MKTRTRSRWIIDPQDSEYLILGLVGSSRAGLLRPPGAPLSYRVLPFAETSVALGAEILVFAESDQGLPRRLADRFFLILQAVDEFLVVSTQNLDNNDRRRPIRRPITDNRTQRRFPGRLRLMAQTIIETRRPKPRWFLIM